MVGGANMVISPPLQAQVAELVPAHTGHVITAFVSLYFLFTPRTRGKQQLILNETINCPITVTTMVGPPAFRTVFVVGIRSTP